MEKIIKNNWFVSCGILLVVTIIMVIVLSGRGNSQAYDNNTTTAMENTYVTSTTTYRIMSENNNESANRDGFRENADTYDYNAVTTTYEYNEDVNYKDSITLPINEEITEDTTAGTSKYYDNVIYPSETETTVKYVAVEIPELSAELFNAFKHQTTNTVWNGGTTAKVMHPEQLEYLNNIAEKWYKGNYSVAQLKDKALNDAPIKTNEDMLQLTGFYQEFIGDEALFKVVDVDAAKVKFEGERTSISEAELWQRLCDVCEDSATANFLYVKACYNENEDNTYVYYFDCKLQWINNNFQW